MEPSAPIRGLIRQSSWLLRIASFLVPKTQRQNWYKRWSTQIWHWVHFLHESGRLNAATRLELAKHLWGAFSDALWHRFNRDKALRLAHEVPRRPRFALGAISVLFLAVLIATGFAPTMRWAFSRLPYKAPDRLLQLSFSGEYIHYHTESLFLTVRSWAQESKTAESLAAYSWEPARITTAQGKQVITGARVSPGFFDVLGVNSELGRVFHPSDDQNCANCIVISNWLWENGFRRDPAIIGKQVPFRGTMSTVVGVLPARFWFISPEISVWTLSQSRRLLNDADHTGLVLRLRPGADMAAASAEFGRLVGNVGSTFGSARAEVTPIKNIMRQGVQVYLLFSLLALIASVAMLALRLTRSVSPNIRVGLRDNAAWWLFFTAKTFLLVATCFVASLEGTRQALLTFTGNVPEYTGAISSWFLLVTTVLAITWSLHDQYRRCHICLKRLEHESYVGVPARLLLDWWGTELVCSQGHGMLHVPEMKASWLEEEHWIQLDESWKALFDTEEAKVS